MHDSHLYWSRHSCHSTTGIVRIRAGPVRVMADDGREAELLQVHTNVSIQPQGAEQASFEQSAVGLQTPPGLPLFADQRSHNHEELTPTIASATEQSPESAPSPRGLGIMKLVFSSGSCHNLLTMELTRQGRLRKSCPLPLKHNLL